MLRVSRFFDRLRKNKSKEPREEGATGILVLYEPKDQKPAVDIVFVHGLNGNREKTWRHDGASAPWPKAFLPHTFPLARIMTYGYDAAVTDWEDFLGKVSKNGIQQHAQNLLETLASRRSDAQSQKRPMFFVCHSLGGIVCKDALVRSREWVTESHLVVLSESTRGVIFLGTPHKGAELASWATRLARVLGVVKQTNVTISKQLQKDSEELDRIQDSFDVLLRSRVASKLPTLEVKCFFEEKPITGIGQVVDYKSAILAGNVPIGINKNHRDMTKFERADEHGYDLITYTLRRWIDYINKQVPPFLPTLSQAPTATFSSPDSSEFHMATTAAKPPSKRRSSSTSSSSRSGFVKIPPGGKFIINEKLVKLPFKFIPSRLTGRESKYFQGRENDLQAIRSILLPPAEDKISDYHRTFSITGLGGSGKTELAFRFVSQLKQTFDAIFFVIADSDSRLLEQFSTISLDPGLVDPQDKSNQELCSESFRAWLSDPVKGAPETQEAKALVKWLLIFDNAENSSVIAKFWPPGNCGSILLTTRNPLLETPDQHIGGKIHLKGFEASEGANLLRQCAKDQKPDDVQTEADATVIAEWVEGFPMPVEQLGRIMYSEQLSISRFLEIYPKKSDLYKRLYDGFEGDQNLIAAWALNKLYEEQQDAFILLSIISMLDPESIEDRTLKPRTGTLNADGTPTTMTQYIAARKHLANTSLISVDRDSQDIRIHRIVQNVTRDMVIRYGLAAHIFKDTIDFVSDQWPFLNRNYVTGSATKVDRWQECRLAYPHILHLLSVYTELVSRSVRSLPTMELAELLLEAAQYKLECGVGHEVVPLLNAVEEAYRQGENNSNVSEEQWAKLYRGKIGLAISAKNMDELLYYAQLAWDIERERHSKLSRESSILAVAYNDLAVAWACYGEWEKATELLEESCAIRKRLPDFTRDKLFSPLYHLGLVQQHQGKYDEAEKILNQAIQDRKDAFGTGDSLSVRSAALFYARGNVRFGRADSAREDVRKSLVDHMEAVSRARRSAGPRNRTTLICQYRVASVYAALGKNKHACDLLCEILLNSLDKPTYYRDTARTSFLYARCLSACNKATEARVELMRCVALHNIIRPELQRTMETLTEDDIRRLIPYDYL